jgi:hypothetical protein
VEDISDLLMVLLSLNSWSQIGRIEKLKLAFHLTSLGVSKGAFMSWATPGNDENLWGRFPTCPTAVRQMGRLGTCPTNFQRRKTDVA